MAAKPLTSLVLCKELVRHWWRSELMITDASGVVPEHAVAGPAATMPVVPSPQNDVCQLSLGSKEGLRRCGASIAFAHEKARARPDTAVRHECHLGFLLLGRSVGEQQGSVVLCGLRERALNGRELEGVTDRLREMRPNGVPEQLEPIPDNGEHVLGYASDFVHLAAQATHDALEREAHPAARPGRGRRASDAGGAVPLIGRSLAMLEVQRLIDRIAQSDTTVLVQGESGTGKELVARQIHERGRRRDRPFVAQNCSALNDNLLESALFGHVRGAFTGATRDTAGIFELADGGTLLLDEMGDMSAALQAKVLRVLQEGTFTPVGGTEERRCDVRVISATHKDLGELVRRGTFREDLYYRINVIRLEVPPLRDREDDVLLLAESFLARHARGERPALSAQVKELFLRYRWPGNVRELQNEIERIVVLGEGRSELGLDLVSARLLRAVEEAAEEAPAFTAEEQLPTMREAVEKLERELLAESLRRNQGNRSAVARELGVARSNLILKLEKYGLT